MFTVLRTHNGHNCKKQLEIITFSGSGTFSQNRETQKSISIWNIIRKSKPCKVCLQWSYAFMLYE